MQVKKAGGRVIGAELTNAEKKALDIEGRKIMAEYNRKNSAEIDAIILWQLHTQLGLGPVRLRRFFDNFAPALRELTDRYEMHGEEEQLWLCTMQLKEYGIDIQKWEEEAGFGK